MTGKVAGLLVLTLIISVEPVVSCTIMYSATDDERLAAKNLDCSNYFPRVWFVPPAEGQYGRFCFGTDENERIAEGGMNDRGLFIGVNALDRSTGWQPDPELDDWEEWEGWYESGVPDGILAKCGTVSEAIAVFRNYNLFTLEKVKFLLADATGVSVIVEWSSGGLAFVKRGDEDHQISTNFVTSDYADSEPPCYRYLLAQKMLTSEGAVASNDLLRRVLSATHLEFQTPTVLSVICDLLRGEIHVYYFHHYEDVIVFRLEEELLKGRHGYLLSEISPLKPYVAKVYEDYGERMGG